MGKWYVVTYQSIKDAQYWEDLFNESTVFVSEEHFEAISTAFYHTHKQCHFVELHDGNIHAYPKYIQQAYHNRENYVSPK